jgi:hypothetical protein
VAAVAALTVSLSATDSAKAEPLPYAYPDFMPTPDRPVYFRQTCGYYPGATPPLEWWEGTPTTKKIKVAGNLRPVEAADFADQKSKNILWKMPVPDWSLAHPVVVAPSNPLRAVPCLRGGRTGL